MQAKKIWSTAAFLFLILAIGFCAYLTQHHYGLLYGMQASKSFCSVNSHFDCDAVNISTLSQIAGIPIAMIGFFGFIVQLLFLIGARVLSEDEKPKASRIFFYLASLNILFCLILAADSFLILKTFCLFCVTLYVLSILIFICAYKLDRLNKFSAGQLMQDLKSWTTVLLLAIVPVGSLLGNSMMMDSISKDMDAVISSGVSEWSQNKKIDFFIKDAPQLGPDNAPLKLTVFSDFQCPACKRSAPTIHAFANAHKDKVQVIYQSYPLSSKCNPKVSTDMHTESCFFSKLSICAHKQGKFQNTHDWIFEHQESLDQNKIDDLVKEVGLDGNAIQSCIKDPDTEKILNEQIQRANLADISSTPSIFANGRLLPFASLIPVLEKVLAKSQEN